MMNDKEFERFLELLAADIKWDSLREIEEAEAHIDEIEMPEWLDISTREMIREYAEEQEAIEREKAEASAGMRRRRAFDKVIRIAAILVVCLSIANCVAMGVSEAYRDRVFSIFESENDGAETLFSNGVNEDFLTALPKEQRELIADWSDFWYPMWLPEGFYLADAENSNMKRMTFLSETSEEQIVITMFDNDNMLTYDSDSAVRQEVRLHGSAGQLVIDEENNYVMVAWEDENEIVRVLMKNTTYDEQVLKIAENMIYIK